MPKIEGSKFGIARSVSFKSGTMLHELSCFWELVNGIYSRPDDYSSDLVPLYFQAPSVNHAPDNN